MFLSGRTKKQRTPVFITTMLLLLGLTVVPTVAVHAQTTESTLHKVQKRGGLVIGTRSTTPGFAFPKDEKGESNT